MVEKNVRVRFAPSPTGGLHLGGVRTALFNYLFAKQHGGKFILRVEDTDQNRYVAGAERYIMDCLSWCGLNPDESPDAGGAYAPYRQSDRKEIYREYAEKLIASGNAYYAFDTSEDLEQLRKDTPNFQYNLLYRNGLKNSLTLPPDEVAQLIAAKMPYVIRIKVPANEKIGFNDMIRGQVTFESNQVDDKVLLKADGMPTYHLAVVVDDYLMKISHAFRGEEWLPSAPVHILLWEYLGWKNEMPQWAHLPLILKPDGNGKLSKRDGIRLGFPVYAMNWLDAKTGELALGFKELGFLPEAFINFLATLGWNDGTDQELFTLKELVEKFSIDRISKAGAKFDYEKAKWFNAEWIKRTDTINLLPQVKAILEKNGIVINNTEYLTSVITLIKDRCILMEDFYQQSAYFFQNPTQIDIAAIKPKWNAEKTHFFETFITKIKVENDLAPQAIETIFKTLAEELGIKAGDLMLPFRVMLVGGKFGPHVFDIASMLGIEATIARIKGTLKEL